MRIIIASTVRKGNSTSSVDDYRRLLGEYWPKVEDIFIMDDGIYEKNVTEFARDLYNVLSCRIDDLLIEVLPVDKIEFGPIAKVEFRDKIWEFRTVDENGDKVMRLFGLFTMIERTLQCNGSLFLFNEDRIKRHNNDRITALLKVKNGLSVSEIKKELDILYSNLTDGNIGMFDLPEIQHNIDFLYSFGLVDIDKDRCVLTARGYMLQTW